MTNDNVAPPEWVGDEVEESQISIGDLYWVSTHTKRLCLCQRHVSQKLENRASRYEYLGPQLAKIPEPAQPPKWLGVVKHVDDVGWVTRVMKGGLCLVWREGSTQIIDFVRCDKVWLLNFQLDHATMKAHGIEPDPELVRLIEGEA